MQIFNNECIHVDLMTYRKQIAETIIETDNNCENLNDKIISRENLLGHID